MSPRRSGPDRAAGSGADRGGPSTGSPPTLAERVLRWRHGLGFAKVSDRRDYPMADLAVRAVAAGAPPSERVWGLPGHRLNQGRSGDCWLYSVLNLLRSGPLRQFPDELADVPDLSCYVRTHYGAGNGQQVECDRQIGFDSRYALDYFLERARVTSYYTVEGQSLYPGRDEAAALAHARQCVETIKTVLLTHGPVVIASPWSNRTFLPTRGGFLRWNWELPGEAGYHAYLLYAYKRQHPDFPEGGPYFALENSWGDRWYHSIRPEGSDRRPRGCARIWESSLVKLFTSPSVGYVATEPKP